MKKKRYSAEQIVRILCEADKDSVAGVAKCRGVSEATIYICRKKFVSMQAEEVKRLKALNAENTRLRKLFVDRELEIDVMYLGQVMEVCGANELLSNPLHPYTQALISAIPSVDASQRRERTVLTGEIPSPLDPPAGCPFQPRCWRAVDRCSEVRPTLQNINATRQVACHVVIDELQTNGLVHEHNA